MKTNILKFWYLFLFPLAWMCVIFYLSHQPTLPGLEIVWQDFIFKKLAHFGVYLVLFLTWWFAFRTIELKTGNILKFKWWLIILICFLYALSDEYHQSFIPGRTSRLYDVGIDMLGSVSAMLFVYRLI